jgi:hypothetical protein
MPLSSWQQTRSAPRVVESVPVGPIPRNGVEQWSAASCSGDAAHGCTGTALPRSIHLALVSHHSASHPQTPWECRCRMQ